MQTMKIDEFCRKHGGPKSTISDIQTKWRKEQVSRDIDALMFAGIITSDGLIGDGLSDRISPDLHDAMTGLMSGKIDSYGDAREYLREVLERSPESISGTINKIKGQVGENFFAEAAEGKAQLATSGSQEGWDLWVENGGIREYVQVKMYGGDNAVARVIDEMKAVQEKVADGTITDGGELVANVNFAVPHDIADQVREAADKFPELADMEVIPVNMTAAEAASVVTDGLDALGPDAMSHLFGELLEGTLGAAAIHSMISAVKVWRHGQAADEAVEQVVGNTLLRGTGYAAGLATEVILDTTLDAMLGSVSLGSGIAVRMALKKASKGRLDAYQNLKLNTEILRGRSRQLAIA
jgi:hypothetical protein